MIKNGSCKHLANGCAKAHNKTARSRELGVIVIAGSFTAIATMINMMSVTIIGNKPVNGWARRTHKRQSITNMCSKLTHHNRWHAPRAVRKGATQRACVSPDVRVNHARW
jgi:hypothetical protein